MRCFNTEDVINSMFDPYNGHFNSEGAGFDTNKVFKIFLKTHTERNQIEVPVFMEQLIPTITSNNIDHTYVCPVSGEEHRIENVGGAATALKHLVNGWGKVLWSVNLKGDVYFGGAGIILDSNYNPLLLTSEVFDINKEYTIVKQRVYLNPEIFTDSSKEINRIINRKFLPHYLLHQKPEIIIGLPSHLMHYAVPPQNEDSKGEQAIDNFTLKENRDEVIESIRYGYTFRGAL